MLHWLLVFDMGGGYHPSRNNKQSRKKEKMQQKVPKLRARTTNSNIPGRYSNEV
jgi:hypothetical protein